MSAMPSPSARSEVRAAPAPRAAAALLTALLAVSPPAGAVDCDMEIQEARRSIDWAELTLVERRDARKILERAEEASADREPKRCLRILSEIQTLLERDER